MMHACTVMDHETLEHFMREALREGRKALPGCRPNPPVGCVIVRGDEIIARGHTQPPGQHHAEAAAMAALEGDLSDCIAFVTLEPCAFHQRTPSCAKGLIDRGIRTVHAAILDPHPRNQGAGIEMLREAGVTVTIGLAEDEAHVDLDPYVWQPGDPTTLGDG